MGKLFCFTKLGLFTFLIDEAIVQTAFCGMHKNKKKNTKSKYVSLIFKVIKIGLMMNVFG
jgi:hypothetical protein